MNDVQIYNLIEDLEQRRSILWATAQVFLAHQDAYGIHDMGVEIQAIDRAIAELNRLRLT